MANKKNYEKMHVFGFQVILKDDYMKYDNNTSSLLSSFFSFHTKPQCDDLSGQGEVIILWGNYPCEMELNTTVNFKDLCPFW